MNPIDTYRELFHKFVADGMSYMEAEEQFGKEELQAAVNAELERGDSVQVFCMDPMGNTNACGHETLFDLVVKAQFERRNLKDFEEQAVPLMLAGWTSEQVNPTNSKDFWRQTQVMSLQWRAPSKRPGKPGRKYLSTTQAFNAMRRAQE
jgi:hypothetical protein